MGEAPVKLSFAMSPQTKKLVSSLVVTVLVALLGTLGNYVARLPPEAQTGALAVVAGLVHFVNAWGHAERQAEAVAEAVSREN